jgi:hypothetical protein
MGNPPNEAVGVSEISNAKAHAILTPAYDRFKLGKAQVFCQECVGEVCSSGQHIPAITLPKMQTKDMENIISPHAGQEVMSASV